MEANCLSRNSMERKIIRNNIHKWLLQVNEKKNSQRHLSVGSETEPGWMGHKWPLRWWGGDRRKFVDEADNDTRRPLPLLSHVWVITRVAIFFLALSSHLIFSEQMSLSKCVCECVWETTRDGARVPHNNSLVVTLTIIYFHFFSNLHI